MGILDTIRRKFEKPKGKLKTQEKPDDIGVTIQQKEIAGKIDSVYRTSAKRLLSREEEINLEIEGDYERSKETLQYYNLIQEDPEKPGTYLYEADYDGAQEVGGTGENFTGRKFIMPTLSEVLSWLTTDQVKLHNEMKEKGLEPRLQLTPIAKSIRSLGKAVAAKRTGPGGLEEILKQTLQEDTMVVWDDIKDQELVYEATGFKAIKDGEKLQVSGGKSKSQFINENQGWVIDIVATKQGTEADEDKKMRTDSRGRPTTVELTNAEKIEKYLAAYQGEGLGYETYAMAQMYALKSGKPLEKDTFTILPGTTLTNQDTIAYGYWYGVYVYLDGYFADDLDADLRFRRSVRVKRLGL